MQLALLVQPLALPHPSEEPIQVISDFYVFFYNFFMVLVISDFQPDIELSNLHRSLGTRDFIG